MVTEELNIVVYKGKWGFIEVGYFYRPMESSQGNYQHHNVFAHREFCSNENSMKMKISQYPIYNISNNNNNNIY